MSQIIILDPETINQIAAGEVIERPVSVVKELVENSIDASAEKIDIEITGGGLESIKITDDGIGMSGQDSRMAVLPHATSKIKSLEDLQQVETLGFRGEALSSIAAVSRLRIRTCRKGDLSGTEMCTRGGEITGIYEIGFSAGTEVLVEDLFFNTPARRKFLKKPALETRRITELVNRMVMSYPGISFSLKVEGRQVLKTRGSGSLMEIISQVYGREKTRFFIPVDYKQEDRPWKVWGYTAKPYFSRSNRSFQNLFVNNRLVKSGVISRALEEAYGTLLPRNSYPAVVLFISLEPESVDVNVHPGKAEVRFADEKEIHRLIFEAINKALKNHNLIPEFNRPVKSREKIFEQASIYPQGEKKSQGNCRDFHHQDQQRGDLHQRNKNVEVEKNIDLRIDEAAGSPYLKIDGSPKNAAEMTASVETPQGDADVGIPSKEHELPVRADNQHQLKDDVEEIEDNLKIFGQFSGTYILAQRNQDLLLIDQHAAHERIIYEKLKEQFYGETIVQEIIPTVLELPAGTALMMEDILDFCRKLNFQVETFGSDSLVLRGVPHCIKDIYHVKLVEELISSFLNQENLNQEKNLRVARDESIIMMACKAACKANYKMTPEAMDALLVDLLKTEVPYTCPHGRPTMIVLTRGELEKNFKRRL